MLIWTSRALSTTLLVLAAGLLATYACGRIASDRWLATQFIWWIPLWLVLPATWLAAAGAWLAGVPARRRRRRAVRRAARAQGQVTAPVAPSSRAGWAILLAALLAQGGDAAWRLRLDRLVRPAPQITDKPVLRVVHWNAMSPDTFPRDVTLPPILGQFDPDIMLFAMALSPAQIEIVMSKVSPAYARHSFGMFHVLSRLPLRHAQSYSLGLARELPLGLDRADPRQIAPPPDETRHTFEYVYNLAARRLGMPPRFFRNTDPGSLLVLRFEGPGRLGREIVVWYIDLPSDPFLSKSDLADRVARRMTDIARDSGAEPDFIVGDFNIPRDSASLGTIAGGRRSAFDDAGWGFFSTWPRARPALHIDHMFMADAWRCVAYQRTDPGRSDHCVQSAVFQAR